MEHSSANLPSSRERRLLRFLVVSGLLMIAFAYLYRWGVTDQSYDIPHAAPRTPTLADTAEPSTAQ